MALDGTWTFDPATNTETKVGGSIGDGKAVNDCWEADTLGTRVLRAAAASPFTGSLTTAVKPTEKLALKLSAVITNHSVNGTVAFTGKDAWGNAINETLTVTGNGTYTTTLYFASVDANGVVAAGTFTVAITQPRWGAVWKQSSSQYAFDCRIVVGDGSTATWFTDTNKQIIINAGIMTANSQNFIYVMNNATATFGALINGTTKQTGNGCDFLSLEATYYGRLIFIQTTSAIVNVYSCSFRATSNEWYWQATTVYNCLTDGLAYFHGVADKACVIDSLLVSSQAFSATSGTGIRRPRAGSTINNVYFKANRNTIWYQSVGGTISNVKAVGGQYLFALQDVTTSDVYGVNVDWDSANWLINWAGTSTKWLYRQYEFDLMVSKYDGTALSTATNGVAVTLTKGTTVINLTTDETGKITTQTLSKGYYDQANGDTIQDAANWTLQVTATGYIPVTRVFSLDQKTSWMCAMHSQLAGDANVGDVASNKKFYKDDADTQLTGTLTQNAGGYVKVIKEKSKLEEPLLLLTANLIIQKQKSM